MTLDEWRGIPDIKLYLGDCLEILPQLEAGSVDAIITDLPYGTTACSWDEVIPFEPMWREVKRLLKERGVFVTTASQPFTSKLVMSNLDWFKYEWIWEKDQAGNFMMARKHPMKVHENVLVFSKNGYLYNPIMEKRDELRIKKTTSNKARKGNSLEIAGDMKTIRSESYDKTVRYPRSVRRFNKPQYQFVDICHPTQKPVALYEYLIKTYTNPADIVLDFCMGSGTTGVACVQTGRNFIGIEIAPNYFEIAEKRIAEARLQPRLLEIDRETPHEQIEMFGGDR